MNPHNMYSLILLNSGDIHINDKKAIIRKQNILRRVSLSNSYYITINNVYRIGKILNLYTGFIRIVVVIYSYLYVYGQRQK